MDIIGTGKFRVLGSSIKIRKNQGHVLDLPRLGLPQTISNHHDLTIRPPHHRPIHGPSGRPPDAARRRTPSSPASTGPAPESRGPVDRAGGSNEEMEEEES